MATWVVIGWHGGGEEGMAHVHASKGEGLILPLAFDVAASLLIPSVCDDLHFHDVP